MKIFDTKRSLHSYLRSLNGKTVTIVTAFASGTQDLALLLAKTNKKVQIIVGTINSFTDPTFVKKVRDAKLGTLDLYVDFRYQSSVHWKLYLVSPSMVVIGSANFTPMGLSLKRDTCVAFDSVHIYRAYMKMINQLTLNPKVLSTYSQKFGDAFETYQAKHVRAQANRLRDQAASRSSRSLNAWLEDDLNQSLPVFIWDEHHTDCQKKRAGEIIKKLNGNLQRADSGTLRIREFFIVDREGDRPSFEQGDVVLCAKNKGQYIDFFTFDIVAAIVDHGCMYDYMICLAKKRYERPFDFGAHKGTLKRLIARRDECGAGVLTREELKSVL
jgi:hypothetical protein